MSARIEPPLTEENPLTTSQPRPDSKTKPKARSARPQRVALTVRLPERLYHTAQTLAAQRGAPLAAVIVAAAEQTLLPDADDASRRETDGQDLLDGVRHCLHKIERLERKLGADLHILKEMVGLALRTYLNHTPAVPESERAAAVTAGRARFERFLDVLSNSLRDGVSILEPDTPPPPEVATASAPKAITSSRQSQIPPNETPADNATTHPVPQETTNHA